MTNRKNFIYLVYRSLFACCFFCFMQIGYGQSNKSDLRIKVESIIKDDIKYTIDSTTNKLPEMKWDTTVQRSLYPSFSTLPLNPLTLIILDGNKTELEDLDAHTLSQVKEIIIYPKNDNVATSIYGTSARNGLIVIELRR